jgi:hypothetical protein
VPPRGAAATATAVAAITTALLAVVVCLAAATSTDTAAIPTRGVARSEVTAIQVWSLPESPSMDWSPARPKWAAALALLPTELPPPASHRSCNAGPVLTVQLRDRTEIQYECSLPTSIRRVRDHLIALAQGRT